MNCKFCGRPNENDPSDHYHYHQCWADDVLKRIREIQNKYPDFTPAPDSVQLELLNLKRELQQARYVGD